jgi:alpha-beta hydrolase superfamily lysophospholipase
MRGAETKPEHETTQAPSRAPGRAEALYFGGASEPLFGWFHAPEGAPRGVGIVLCNPLGYEAVCSHRAYRHLAQRLARAGFAALRFDYHGTGDSFGSDGDPDRVRAFRESIDAAIEELRARSGATEVGLFGVRAGALLAATVAAARSDVRALALFGPCAAGRAYVRELRALGRLKGGDATPGFDAGEAQDEIAGFRIAASTMEELGALDIAALDALAGRKILVVGRDDMKGDERLVERLKARGADAAFAAAPGYAAMMVDPHKSVVPDAAFACIESWLHEHYPTPRSPEHRPVATTSPEALLGGVREQPLRFGADARLFGLLTEPREVPSRRRPAVLLLNAGSVHRIGPNRMYVTMARSWAALGFSVFRLDIAGIGDSASSDPALENQTYSKHAVRCVKEAMALLAARRGVERFVLVGLCSGAYVAFHASLGDPKVAGALMINPQTFHWREGDSIEVARRDNYKEALHYRRSALDPERWAKALRGDVDFKHVFAVLASRVRIVAETKLKAIVDDARGTDEARLPRTFRALVDGGTDAFLIFSRDDPGLDYIEVHLGDRGRRLAGRPNFRFEVIDGPDHTFTPLWAQRRLLEMLTEHLTSRFG